MKENGVWRVVRMERGYSLNNVKLTVQLALAAPVGAAPLVHLKLATVPAG